MFCSEPPRHNGVVHITTICEVVDCKAARKIVAVAHVLEKRGAATGAFGLDMSVLAVFVLVSVATDVLGDLVEICDPPQGFAVIVWQADVEEAAVLLGDKLVHVSAAGAHKQKIVFGEELRGALLGGDLCLRFHQLSILILR